MNPIRKIITPGNIVFIAVFTTFFLWLQSVEKSRFNLENAGLGHLGLITVLPNMYFVSFGLLTCSFLANLALDKKNKMLLVSQTMLLILFLDFTPALIEGTARFNYAYAMYKSIEYILQDGYVNPLAVWAHNWPGFFLLFNAFVQVTNLPKQTLLSLYPTFSHISLFFPLYAFFRLVSNDERHRWMAIWIFYIANWIGQNYFSPQSIGLFMYVSMLFLMLRMKGSENRTNRRNLIVLILFLSFLVFNHMLSSLFLLSCLVVFFALKYFQRLKFVALSIVLFASWTMYGAATYLQWNLPRFISEAFNVELIYTRNIEERIAGFEARIIVTQIRLMFSAIISILALSGIILTWKYGKMKSFDKRMLALLAAVIFFLPLFSYGGELFMRMYLFSLIPLAYFISRNSISKTVFCFLIIFVVVIAPPLHIIAHYGNEVVDYVPMSEIRSIEFFYDTTTRGYIIGGSILVQDYQYHRTYEFFGLRQTKWKNNRLIIQYELENLDWPRFICINREAREYYNFFLGNPRFINDLQIRLSQSAHCSKVYSNPSFEIYIYDQKSDLS